MCCASLDDTISRRLATPYTLCLLEGDFWFPNLTLVIRLMALASSLLMPTTPTSSAPSAATFTSTRTRIGGRTRPPSTRAWTSSQWQLVSFALAGFLRIIIAAIWFKAPFSQICANYAGFASSSTTKHPFFYLGKSEVLHFLKGPHKNNLLVNRKSWKKPITHREPNPRPREFFLCRRVLFRCATTAAQGFKASFICSYPIGTVSMLPNASEQRQDISSTLASWTN